MQSKLEILSTRGWFLQEWIKQDRVSLWGKAKEAIIEWDINRTENAWWTQIIEYKWITICYLFFHVRRMGTLNPRSRVQELPEHVHVNDPSYTVR